MTNTNAQSGPWLGAGLSALGALMGVNFAIGYGGVHPPSAFFTAFWWSSWWIAYCLALLILAKGLYDLKKAAGSPEKRFQMQMALGWISYVCLLASSLLIAERYDTVWIQLPAVLLPMLPVVAMLRAYLGMLRSMDELMRRVELEAVSIAAAIVGLGSFSIAFVQGIGLIPQGGLIFVLPALILSWQVGRRIALGRYT